ncbi:hypothetical protein LZ554_002419 [Drepanopeziza brunnea f. sp. 'monogermtubi']|nr:hypothetical protein LZ554_002419 [Drepanopeziza brunnea f. sp. 'monogermtubi']
MSPVYLERQTKVRRTAFSPPSAVSEWQWPRVATSSSRTTNQQLSFERCQKSSLRKMGHAEKVQNARKPEPELGQPLNGRPYGLLIEVTSGNKHPPPVYEIGFGSPYYTHPPLTKKFCCTSHQMSIPAPRLSKWGLGKVGSMLGGHWQGDFDKGVLSRRPRTKSGSRNVD